MATTDLPNNMRSQQARALPVSGSHLEMLGKMAASAFRNGAEPSLTQAVVRVVRHERLSPEQVQRVIEFCNTDAFLQQFRQDGQAHRVVELRGGPAVPSDVLNDLNDGGGGTVFDTGLSDYATPPKSVKTAAEIDIVDQVLQDGFGRPDPIVYDSPLEDVGETRRKMAAAVEELRYQLGGLQSSLWEAEQGLFHQVKTACLEGASLTDVVTLWSTSPWADGPMIKTAFEFLAPRLVQNQVFSSGEELVGSFSKTASAGLPNQEHPLYQCFESYAELVTKTAAAVLSIDEFEQGQKQLRAFEKEAEGLIHAIKDVARAGGGVARKGVELGGGFLLGPNHKGVQQAGQLTEKAVSYAPEAAALIGANELRRKAKYSPTANKALSFMPGTQAYQQREYEIAAQQGGMNPYQGY